MVKLEGQGDQSVLAGLVSGFPPFRVQPNEVNLPDLLSLLNASPAGHHLLPGSQPTQTLARAIIHKRFDAAKFLIADFCERTLFRIEPANQSIGILIGSPFPRVIGMSEEYIHGHHLGDLFVVGELFAIVEGHSLANLLRQGGKQAADLACDFPSLLAVRAGDQQEARVAFNQRDQVARLVCPVDQVSFPITNTQSGFHRCRTGVNRPLVWDPSAATPFLPWTSALALALGARKMPPQASTGLGIGIDVLVDRFLANPGPALQFGYP